MTDYEQTVLEHYQLSTAYPDSWPADKDLSDASEEEDTKPAQKDLQRRKSRYAALERAASDRRSFLPGSQRADNGVENLVQRDEADPLGTTDSVVRILRQLSLPVQDDPKLRGYTPSQTVGKAKEKQVIGSCYPPQPSRLRYSCLRSMRPHRPNPY
jgi:exocyst complex component 2